VAVWSCKVESGFDQEGLMVASTKKSGFARMQRVSAILAKRYSGKSLADIGAEEGVSPQAIHSLIQRALGQIPQQAVADIRILECGRLDELLAAIWPAAKLGDIAAIDRVLAIMKRRAAMMGLDLQPGYFSREDGDGDADRRIQVEIIGNPEPQRVAWLEWERERLLALTEGSTPPGSTLN
jgi:hypothetical protein